MGIFSKKDGGPKVPREVANLPWVKHPAPIDDDFGRPEPAATREALARGDWQAARQIITTVEPSMQGACVGSRYEEPAPVEAAERWVAAAPDDGWGHMVLGDALVTWAWQARGGGWASTVQEDSWQIFFERLRRAEDALTTAARLLPESHLPWGRLIWSGIGLQIPLEELTVRYDEGNRRAPFDNGLVSSALQMLCAKWYGSREHMFAYARMVATEAPAGSPAVSVVAMAYIEDVVARQRETDIEEALKSLEGPEVGTELREAAERSIFHPDFVQDISGLGAANCFMVAFYGGHHYAECHRVLTLLRGRYCSSPMDYLGDPGRMNRKAEILTAREMGLLKGPTRTRR